MRINKIVAKSVYLFILLLVPMCCLAQENRGLYWAESNGLEYRIKAGFNIGGTSPIPLPAEIRTINHYAPVMNMSLEGSTIKWFDNSKWGALLGLRFEGRGMSTDATVKNYTLTLDAPGGGTLDGMWTGRVTTTVNNYYLTLPLQGIFEATPRLDLKFGPYVSFLLDGNFSGYAYDGYLREGGPTGEKVILDGQKADYDFSNNLRKIEWGVTFGAEWQAYKHLVLVSDLTWGVNPIFENGFESVSFNMYSIYLNLGFGYIF